jgi:hypothetical protein
MGAVFTKISQSIPAMGAATTFEVSGSSDATWSTVAPAPIPPALSPDQITIEDWSKENGVPAKSERAFF